jgi:hypothetical protein
MRGGRFLRGTRSSCGNFLNFLLKIKGSVGYVEGQEASRGVASYERLYNRSGQLIMAPVRVCALHHLNSSASGKRTLIFGATHSYKSPCLLSVRLEPR